jgi:two-component system response regulator FixJ
MSANPHFAPATKPLVCIIDADEATRESIRTLLNRLGVEIRAFAAGHDFLRTLTESVPACLIAEATMTDMTGIELMQELRRRGLDVPTILLSRNEDVSFAVAAMRAGALDFVQKPYIDRSLLQHVGHLLTPNSR